jgi:hypothetical protein
MLGRSASSTYPYHHPFNSESMPDKKKDLLDLDSIDPSDPFMGHLGTCAHDLMMAFTISV